MPTPEERKAFEDLVVDIPNYWTLKRLFMTVPPADQIRKNHNQIIDSLPDMWAKHVRIS